MNKSTTTQTPIPPAHTQAPIPSAIPQFTATNTPQIISLPTPITSDPSIELMVAPEDIKKEMIAVSGDQTSTPEGFRGYFGYPIGGFGGGIVCEEITNKPYFLHSPTIFKALSPDPWGEDQIDTCGWAEGETVNITITKPDGTKETSQQISENGLSVSFRPQMNYGMQLGNYTATFSSPSGRISLDFSVIRPTAPGLATVNEKDYYAYGFDPEEPVNILAYKIMKESRLIELVSWKETKTDNRGELFFENQTASDLLAVSDSSGSFIVWSNTFWGILIGDKFLFHQIDPCEGAPVSRLQTYDMAYVLEGAPNNVRSSPSVSADLVGTAVPGTILYVGKNAPVCADGYLWWYVFPMVGNDPTGWTAEGKGSDYWLAPNPWPPEN